MRDRQRRLFEIVEVGAGEDRVSRLYDFINVFAIIVNLVASVLMTFSEVASRIGGLLTTVETVTVIFFAVDYALRLATARFLYPEVPAGRARTKYITSFTGIVDLFSFLPYFLPFLIPEGAVAFRMFRIVRILRLFRVNAYYDSLNVITDVLKAKKQQLLSSVFIILVLMLASSLCMYSLENEAQPEVFSNAFSGIWWSVSTLLTVGYGDIYPITTLGRVFGAILTFLGVGMVAIPTGIISAGFIEQYGKLQRSSDEKTDSGGHFIEVVIEEGSPRIGDRVSSLEIPGQLVAVMVGRGEERIRPDEDTVMEAGDRIFLYNEKN